ncbi:hypothetical protein GTP45_27050 [Pseudoduganella sp. FT55W]|uniref:Uncharacterized protein n=1 Tax=Duganella rivi TaxID=2666083 RepID=A0A7X4GVG1_9BURK|nr:hypothetical protein [Duganella rivi]MYM70438.1 hypothetical protein [Duganella rivi]
MNPITDLSPWRQRQVAMLYRYASLDYMKALDDILSRVIEGHTTPAIEQSLAASYAEVMSSQQRMHNDPRLWERKMRETLTEMRQLLREDINARSRGRYRAGSLNHFFKQVCHADSYDGYRMSDEYHVCEHFVSKYSAPTDSILVEHLRQQPPDERWFTHHLAQHLLDQPDLPQFRVRTDITARSGESPPRAGVYIRQDDPAAPPQFAWPEKDRGQLVDSGAAKPRCGWYYVELKHSLMSGTEQR